MKAKQETQSVLDGNVWWTIEKAALHLGIHRKTIKRYIREGLPLRHGRLHREELLAEVRKRQMRQRATRAKSDPL